MEAHPCDKESFLDKVWRYVNEIVSSQFYSFVRLTDLIFYFVCQDFVAQKKLEKFSYISQSIVAIVSFVISWHFQSFQICILTQLVWAIMLMLVGIANSFS